MWPWTMFLVIWAAEASMCSGTTLDEVKHCSALRLRAPYIEDQSGRIGRVYHLTDRTHQGRPTFSTQLSQNTMDWIYYNETSNAWSISEWGYTSFYVESNSSHPLLARGSWHVHNSSGTFVENSAVNLECIKEPRLKGHNCSKVRYNTPFISGRWNTAGAVFTQMNASVLGRPVFEFYDEYTRSTTFLYYSQFKTTRWSLGRNYGSKPLYIPIRMFANTNASHPGDIEALWYYAENNTDPDGWLPESESFFECLSDEVDNGPSDCATVKLEGNWTIPGDSSVNNTAGIHVLTYVIGMLFHRTQKSLNNRPVFRSVFLGKGNVFDMFFSDSTWVIGNMKDLLQDKGWCIAKSNTYHPADVRALWYCSNGTSMLPFADGSVVCSKDKETTCKTVKITGSGGQEIKNITGQLFDQTNKDSQGYPIFKQSTSSNHPFYLVHSGSNWYISSNIQRSPTPYSAIAYGNQSHPVDVISTWFSWELQPIHDFSVSCFSNSKVDNSVSKASKPTGLLAGVAVSVCTVVVLAAVILTVWIKKPAFLVRIRNRFTILNEDDLNYDVFICYKCGGPGQNFAVHVLYPKLHEEWGLNTAIDAKDFVPGTPIDENIGRLIEDSKRIILVLTQDFLQSGWCRLECSSAHYQMATGKTKVIPVMLEDITDSTDLHPSLRHIIKTVTYLEVPASKTGRDMERFWTRLKRSLPKPGDSETSLQQTVVSQSSSTERGQEETEL